MFPVSRAIAQRIFPPFIQTPSLHAPSFARGTKVDIILDVIYIPLPSTQICPKMKLFVYRLLPKSHFIKNFNSPIFKFNNLWAGGKRRQRLLKTARGSESERHAISANVRRRLMKRRSLSLSPFSLPLLLSHVETEGECKLAFANICEPNR